MANTIWDELDKNSNVTISGAGLIAAISNFNDNKGIRILDGKTAGKFYVEITVSGGTGGNTVIGVATRGVGWDESVNKDKLGVYCYANFDIYFNGSSTGLSIGGFTSGGVIRIAANFDNSRVWFSKNGGNWNGSGAADPATNTGGINISSINGHPWFILVGTNTTNNPTFTANLGDSAFTYSVPSGFTSGWPTDPDRVMGSRWNTSDTVGFVLSHDDRTIASMATIQCIGRTVSILPNDKRYFEYMFNNSVGGLAGLAKLTATGADYVTNTADDALAFSHAPPALERLFSNGASVVSYTYQHAGFIVGFAIDVPNALAWVRDGGGDWNNNPAADPATGVGGVDISSIGATMYGAMGVGNNNGTVVSINASNIAKLTTPAGYEVGFGLLIPHFLAADQQIPAFGQVARFGVRTVNDSDLLGMLKPIVLIEIDAWR